MALSIGEANAAARVLYWVGLNRRDWYKPTQEELASALVLLGEKAGKALQMTYAEADIRQAVASFTGRPASDLDGAMYRVWRHGDWRAVTVPMSDEERDAAADAVLRHDANISADHDSPDPFELRWWR